VSNKGAFTLVEVMVVIAVIGIVAAVAINISSQLSERRHIKTLESDLNGAYKAALRYFTEEQGAHSP
jgi:prepilin-type N-terminal cleavage/methylation domain-containing protein